MAFQPGAPMSVGSSARRPWCSCVGSATAAVGPVGRPRRPRRRRRTRRPVGGDPLVLHDRIVAQIDILAHELVTLDAAGALLVLAPGAGPRVRGGTDLGVGGPAGEPGVPALA